MTDILDILAARDAFEAGQTYSRDPEWSALQAQMRIAAGGPPSDLCPGPRGEELILAHD